MPRCEAVASNDRRRHFCLDRVLRDTGSPACNAVDDVLDGDLAVGDAISMEILDGARDDHHLTQLRGHLSRSTMLPTTPADYDRAAALYGICRRRGETVRKLINCLVATVAIEADAEVLHADVDFATVARHTALRTNTDSNI